LEFLTALFSMPRRSPCADVAWFASYARDARHRVETADLPAPPPLRTALEEPLGISFSGEKASTSSARHSCRRFSTGILGVGPGIANSR
jgi:hypothetical protein